MKPTLSLLFLALTLLAQDQLPHRSAVTPPPQMEMAFLHRVPTNSMFLHLPSGKKAEMFQLGSMQTDELLEKIRTNRYNLFLIELSDAGPAPLRSALISPEDELVLSNFHRAMPRTP